MAIGNAAQAIITKGLSCGQTTACENGTMLTAGFLSLYCANPFKEPGGGGGGGPGVGGNTVTRPLQPGEISQLYQPLPDSQQHYVVPRDQEAEYFRTFTPVKIELKIGKIEIDKQYMIPQGKARAIFNTVNMINATKDRVSASVSNIKRITSRVVVSVTNFALRRNNDK